MWYWYGLDIWKKGEKIRLSGINAREIRGVENIKGRETRDILREWILGKGILLQTFLDKKWEYSRYLGVIWANGENINEKLVREGLVLKKKTIKNKSQFRIFSLNFKKREKQL